MRWGRRGRRKRQRVGGSRHSGETWRGVLGLLLVCGAGGERTLGAEGGGDGRWIILVELISVGLLLLELHGAHATDGLFALYTLLFACLEDLFVLDTQLAPLNIEAVEGSDDRVCVDRLAEVGKGEAAEGALLVEMVVEGIGGGNRERSLGGKRVRMGR